MKVEKRTGLVVAAVLALSACGGGNSAGNVAQTQAQNSAATLRNAAEQSTPQARQVLLNEAERIETQNIAVPPGTPGSPVQEAMEKAGNAAAAPLPEPRQAVPNRSGTGGQPPATTPTP